MLIFGVEPKSRTARQSWGTGEVLTEEGAGGETKGNTRWVTRGASPGGGVCCITRGPTMIFLELKKELHSRPTAARSTVVPMTMRRKVVISMAAATNMSKAHMPNENQKALERDMTTDSLDQS